MPSPTFDTPHAAQPRVDSTCPYPAAAGIPGGFTLLEIVAVIMIMAALSAVVATKVMDSDEVNLRTEADVLASHLRYAQAMSMGTLTPYGISYAAGTPVTYTLFRSTAPATPLAMPGEQSPTVSMPSGLGLALSTGGNVITFTAMGVPCSDTSGAVPLAADATFTLSLSGNNETVTVTQETGFIP